jgi:hypothetical protein
MSFCASQPSNYTPEAESTQTHMAKGGSSGFTPNRQVTHRHRISTVQVGFSSVINVLSKLAN